MWHRAFRFLWVASGLAWVMQVFRFLPVSGSRRAIQVVTKDDDPGFHYHPPPGIPEADLTENHRLAAGERMKREQSIRRARPD